MHTSGVCVSDTKSASPPAENATLRKGPMCTCHQHAQTQHICNRFLKSNKKQIKSKNGQTQHICNRFLKSNKKQIKSKNGQTQYICNRGTPAAALTCRRRSALCGRWARAGAQSPPVVLPCRPPLHESLKHIILFSSKAGVSRQDVI
jgi:hypothetical protein